MEVLTFDSNIWVSLASIVHEEAFDQAFVLKLLQDLVRGLNP